MQGKTVETKLTVEDFAKAAAVISKMGYSVDEITENLNKFGASAAKATEAGYILEKTLCEYRKARLSWYKNKYGWLRWFHPGFWQTKLGL